MELRALDLLYFSQNPQKLILRNAFFSVSFHNLRTFLKSLASRPSNHKHHVDWQADHGPDASPCRATYRTRSVYSMSSYFEQIDI